MSNIGRPQEGTQTAKGMTFGIVVSRFNENITKKLLKGCVDILRARQAALKNIKVVWVPGAFEIPLAADRLAARKKFDGIICLGAVIRGQTPHFEYVAGTAANGISRVMLKYGIPCGFGLITAHNARQARERSTGENNKGKEAALCTIEMIHLIRNL